MNFLSLFHNESPLLIFLVILITLIAKIPFVIFRMLERKREQAVSRLLNGKDEKTETFEEKSQRFNQLIEKKQVHVNLLVGTIMALSLLVVLPSMLILAYESNLSIWPFIALILYYCILCVRQTIRLRNG